MMRIFFLTMSFFCAVFPAEFTLTDDWHLNELMRQLELRGDVGMLRGFLPFYASDVMSAAQKNKDAFWVKRAERLISPLDVRDGGFALWTPGIWAHSTSSNGTVRRFGRMRVGLGGAYKNWSICGIYRLDSGYYEDPDYYGIRWERIAGKADQVFLRWSGGDFFFQLGRDYLRTGLGMALSGEKPYEKIAAGFKIGKRIKLLWSIGQLNEYVEYDDTTKIIYYRYLAGHRAEVSWKWLQVGFTELIIFGGVGRQLEFYYLLPLYAYHGEQLNHRWDDNTLWSLDTKVLLPPFRLLGELIIDDFQIERQEPGDREPPLIGFAIKTEFAALSSPLFLTTWLRYEQVRNRVFNQQCPWNRYLYESKPLGTPLGNDYEQLSAGCNVIGSFYGGSLSSYYRRKGEGRIDDEWTTPWVDNPAWSEPFPSGIVEEHIGLEWSIWADGLNVDIGPVSLQSAIATGGMWEKISNLKHQNGKSGNNWEIRAEVETRIWSRFF